MTFEPRNLEHCPGFVRFEDADGLVYEVHGDESMLQIAFELANSIETVLQQSRDLLQDFMKHSGTFTADYVEVLAAPDKDGAEICIRHVFAADDNPHEFGYTYFDVYITVRVPPPARYWPIKFVVGFW